MDNPEKLETLGTQDTGRKQMQKKLKRGATSIHPKRGRGETRRKDFNITLR
jgi:hypothetical protein